MNIKVLKEGKDKNGYIYWLDNKNGLLYKTEFSLVNLNIEHKNIKTIVNKDSEFFLVDKSIDIENFIIKKHRKNIYILLIIDCFINPIIQEKEFLEKLDKQLRGSQILK